MSTSSTSTLDKLTFSQKVDCSGHVAIVIYKDNMNVENMESTIHKWNETTSYC